ncbi:MAG: hypothetical protein HYY11_05660 [Candidatus Methylomirabilis oxyfera]|nr:hypothetical protein [Candidatus Methylomirabilis oxyfera]
MIEKAIGSWDAVPAVREAEKIVRWEADGACEGVEAKKLRQSLLHALLGTGFLVLCVLPPLTVLVLLAVGIFFPR